ncbi:hypothetical protein CY35_09G059900 [Sphagnum magellanicum]|nr:hypothetical protein CY35_09G059900 [Sphagnum magellanicum]
MPGRKEVKEYEVSPRILRFTQLDIGAHFKEPYQHTKIEDAVNMILRQEKAPSDFGKLRVVRYDDEFWSLDNRRLWVFKKARVENVTVLESKYHAKVPRFQAMLDDPQLMNKLRSENFVPRIRGSKPPHFKCGPHAKFPRVHQVANAHLRKPAAGKDQAAPETAVHEQQQQFVYRVVQRAGGPLSIAAGYSSSSTYIARSQSAAAKKVAHSQASNLLPADYKQPNNRPVYTRVQQVPGAAAAVTAAGVSVVAAGSSHVKNYHPWNPSLLHEGASSSVVNGYFPKQDQASHHVIQIPSDLPDRLRAKLPPAATRDQDWYSAHRGRRSNNHKNHKHRLKTTPKASSAFAGSIFGKSVVVSSPDFTAGGTGGEDSRGGKWSYQGHAKVIMKCSRVYIATAKVPHQDHPLGFPQQIILVQDCRICFPCGALPGSLSLSPWRIPSLSFSGGCFLVFSLSLSLLTHRMIIMYLFL